MKRKKRIPPRVRSRVDLDDLAFDFTYEQPSDNSKMQLNVRILSGRHRDTKHFEIRFNPPLKKLQASRAQLKLIYVPLKISSCSIVVIPASERQTPSTIVDRHFVSFDTHTIQIDPKTGHVVLLYLAVRNVQMNGSVGSPPQFEPIYGLFHDRYKGLPFFIPDPDLNLHLSVNASLISQHNPLWFKLRGELTGSGLSGLLGFYVPELGSKEATNWSFDKKDFDGWKAVGIRFGNVSEDLAIISLLEHNKDLWVEECGYFQHPDPNRSNWGASPDGILTDPTVKYPKDYQFALENVTDRHRGVLEIKSSRWNCKFNAYFFPQVIWEMVNAQTYWGDVVRYAEMRVMDEDTRMWTTKQECRKVRIFRHIPTEQQMVHLVLKSLACKKRGDKNKYMQLVHSNEFVEFRKQFEAIAEQANEQYENIPIAVDAIAQLLNSRTRQIQNQDQYVPSLHPAIDRIEERQTEIFMLYQEPKKSKKEEFVKKVSEQVQDYMTLLRDA